VGVFYFYYLVLELLEVRAQGAAAYLRRMRSWMMMTNILLYLTQTWLQYEAVAMLPDHVGMVGPDFDITLRPAMVCLRTSVILQVRVVVLQLE
jgi:hypothetical protein